MCLFGNKEISLKDAIRNNCSEDDLIALIASAVKRKKKQHAGKEITFNFLFIYLLQLFKTKENVAFEFVHFEQNVVVFEHSRYRAIWDFFPKLAFCLINLCSCYRHAESFPNGKSSDDFNRWIK